MKLIPSWLQKPLESGLAPIASGLVVARIHPNTITTIGFFVLAGSGVAFGVGQIRLGGALVLMSGVVDMLDGQVARSGGQMSRFGAFYDSTLDRIGESAVFGGIIVFFVMGGVPERWMLGALVSGIVALSTGLIVSYTRARAEGLMLDCKVGLAQRAERILGLGAPTVLFGAGRDGMLLLAIVTVLASLAVITVIQRVYHIFGLSKTATRDAPVRDPVGALADSFEKESGGD